MLHLSPYPSDKERVADVTTFLLAGHDTTGYQIAWIIIEVSRHPLVLQKIRAELDMIIPDRSGNVNLTPKLLGQMNYLTMVIREGMRLWPVLPIGSNRVVNKDISFKDYVIPKGATIGKLFKSDRSKIQIVRCQESD
jgi:retinoid hydroxylase